MFMDFIDFLNGRIEVVIFSTDERNFFRNNFTYGPVVFGSRRRFAATLWTTTVMFHFEKDSKIFASQFLQECLLSKPESPRVEGCLISRHVV